MSGDKIVLLDGMGSSGLDTAASGLLSLVPSMFASAFTTSKTDPALIAALMNGRNNQDNWGGSGCWWMWIILLFWMFGGNGFFGNGFGRGGMNGGCMGLPAALNGDAGRELLMQAIQGNRDALGQLSSTLNCDVTSLQNAINNIYNAVTGVAGKLGMSEQAVINAIQSQGCEIGNQISSCCCNLQGLINNTSCNINNNITQQGFNNQLRTIEQTNTIQNAMNQGFNANQNAFTSQINALSAKMDAQTNYLTQQFNGLEKREMQNKIDQLREEKAALQNSALLQQQSQNLVNQLRPTPVPSYPSCSPYQAYSWSQVTGNACCNNNTCCANNNNCC